MWAGGVAIATPGRLERTGLDFSFWRGQMRHGGGDDVGCNEVVRWSLSWLFAG